MGATNRFVADVKMISYEQEKRVFPDKFMRAMDRVSVAERLRLFDKIEAVRMCACSRTKGGLVSRSDDSADFVDSGAEDFLEDDGERGFGRTVPVDKGLERQCALAFAGGGDDGASDFHSCCASVTNMPRTVNRGAHPKRLGEAPRRTP